MCAGLQFHAGIDVVDARVAITSAGHEFGVRRERKGTLQQAFDAFKMEGEGQQQQAGLAALPPPPPVADANTMAWELCSLGDEVDPFGETALDILLDDAFSQDLDAASPITPPSNFPNAPTFPQPKFQPSQPMRAGDGSVMVQCSGPSAQQVASTPYKAAGSPCRGSPSTMTSLQVGPAGCGDGLALLHHCISL